jgi:hypothetical protein
VLKRMQQSMILGNLDPSGAAATWRAYYSKRMDRIITTSSAASEFRTFGNMIRDNHAFNFKRQCVTGIRGAAFDQQTDQEYWQNKQLLPNINRPLGSGPRNAAIINEGVYNINPIAGTNDFSGMVISRATGLNPTNYSLVNTDDIQDRLRANTVPSNDPLSAQFALRLQAGNQVDPNNVEGDAMVNTFQNKQSIARAAKTQVIDENLVSADSEFQDPTFEAGIINKALNFKNRNHIETMPEGRRLAVMVNNWVESALRNQKRIARGHNAADDSVKDVKEEEEEESDVVDMGTVSKKGGDEGGDEGGSGGGESMGGGGGSQSATSLRFSSGSGKSVKPSPSVRGNPTGSGQRRAATTTFTDASGMYINNPDDLSVKSPMQANTFRDRGSVSQNVQELAGNVNRQPFRNDFGKIRAVVNNLPHNETKAVAVMASGLSVGHKIAEIAKREVIAKRGSSSTVVSQPQITKSKASLVTRENKKPFESTPTTFDPQPGDEVFVRRRRRGVNEMEWDDGQVEFYEPKVHNQSNIVFGPVGSGKGYQMKAAYATTPEFDELVRKMASSSNPVIQAMAAGMSGFENASAEEQQALIFAVHEQLKDETIKKIALVEAQTENSRRKNFITAKNVMGMALENSTEVVTEYAAAIASGSDRGKSAPVDELSHSSMASTLPTRATSTGKPRDKTPSGKKGGAAVAKGAEIMTGTKKELRKKKTDSAQSDNERKAINEGASAPSVPETQGVETENFVATSLPIMSRGKSPLKTGGGSVKKGGSRPGTPTSMTSFQNRRKNNQDAYSFTRLEEGELVLPGISPNHIEQIHAQHDTGGTLRDVPGIENIKFSGEINPYYNAGVNMGNIPTDLTPVISNVNNSNTVDPIDSLYRADLDRTELYYDTLNGLVEARTQMETLNPKLAERSYNLKETLPIVKPGEFEYEDIGQAELEQYQRQNRMKINEYLSKSNPKLTDLTYYTGDQRERFERVKEAIPSFTELVEIEEQRSFAHMLDTFYYYHYETASALKTDYYQLPYGAKLDAQNLLEKHFNEQIEKLLPHCINVIHLDPEYALYMLHQVAVKATRDAGSEPLIGLRDVFETGDKVHYRLSYDNSNTPQFKFAYKTVAPKVVKTTSYKPMETITEEQYKKGGSKVALQRKSASIT